MLTLGPHVLPDQKCAATRHRFRRVARLLFNGDEYLERIFHGWQSRNDIPAQRGLSNRCGASRVQAGARHFALPRGRGGSGPTPHRVPEPRPGFREDCLVPPYREWGRTGPPLWVFWAIIAGLIAVIVGLLVSVGR
jgi:hypothetical protein